ncbi:MAG: carbon starvation protein A [Planctomycetes bacterium]|nr:carbon starvation protein A [Planctomycetota bacterium]
MLLLGIVLGTAVVLVIAYRTYGSFLSRMLGLDPERKTPAYEKEDGVDFIPTGSSYLLGQHFTAIAAAGPIVGPILAGLWFGWAPALVWIILGSIFIGGVHDFTALVASVRHQAKSIAEVVKESMNRRAYLLFLAFVWLALVYVIIAFTDVTAAAFVKDLQQSQVEAHTADAANLVKPVRGAAVAGSSILYLVLAVLMGLSIRFFKISENRAAVIFVPLIFVCIWAGQFVPLDFAGWFFSHLDGPEAERAAIKTWDLAILGYCCIAAVVPMWALLQPRGYLGAFFMYIALAGSVAGLLVGAWGGDQAVLQIQYPAYLGFETGAGTLFPVLFVTVACGACSGFHALVASGTTSRQLKCEPDAKRVAYGAMLLEAFVALIALVTVMILTPAQADKLSRQPNLIYAHGLADFFAVFSSSPAFKSFAITFGLLAFATFVYDTLDVCTRLGRYILQELTGLQGRTGAVICTMATIVPAALLVTSNLSDPLSGKPVPAWRYFWGLFGTSNQLLAALTLVGVATWLKAQGRKWWYAALPAVFMMAVTLTSLAQIIWTGWTRLRGDKMVLDLNFPIALALLALAGVVLIEAVRVIVRQRPPLPQGAG